MSTEAFLRKNEGLVSNDLQALRAAKARKASSNKLGNLETRLEKLESKIDKLYQLLEERVITNE